MSADWPTLFKDFFENSCNQKRLGVVGLSQSTRELWLQGEMFYWFREVQRDLPGMGQVWVNITAFDESTQDKELKKIRPDMVFRDWDFAKKRWKGGTKMVAEIKFLGFSYQPKTIYGGPLKNLPGNYIINPKSVAALEPKPKANSLIHDYCRLLALNQRMDPKAETYLILVCSKYRDDRKKASQMIKILESIEFEKKAVWEVEIGKAAPSTAPKPHPFYGAVKLWSIRGKPLTGIGKIGREC